MHWFNQEGRSEQVANLRYRIWIFSIMSLVLGLVKAYGLLGGGRKSGSILPIKHELF